MNHPVRIVKGLSKTNPDYTTWDNCMPGDITHIRAVESWDVMPLHAFKEFKKFTGLKFLPDTKLVRNGGLHIFAIHPDFTTATCVYRFTRTFGEPKPRWNGKLRPEVTQPV